MSENHWDEPFLRSVAVLQAQSQFLEARTAKLTDLTDMQSQRRLKADLADYIRAHAAAGTLPRDPLKELENRLQSLMQFFSETKALHTEILDSHKLILGEVVPPVSEADLHAALRLVDIWQENLPAQLESLRQKLNPLDWDGDGMDAAPHPELLVCARNLGHKFPERRSEQIQLRLFAHGRAIYAEAQEHLIKVQQTAHGLLALYSEHWQALDLAADAVSKGNHISAEKILNEAGLANKNIKGFSELPYRLIQDELAALKARASAIVDFCASLSQLCETVLNRFNGLAATPQAKYAAKVELKTFKQKLDAHATQVADWPGSEFELHCLPSIECAKRTLSWTHKQLNATAATAATAASAAAAAASAEKRLQNRARLVMGITVVIIIGVIWAIYPGFVYWSFFWGTCFFAVPLFTWMAFRER